MAAGWRRAEPGTGFYGRGQPGRLGAPVISISLTRQGRGRDAHGRARGELPGLCRAWLLCPFGSASGPCARRWLRGDKHGEDAQKPAGLPPFCGSLRLLPVELCCRRG